MQFKNLCVKEENVNIDEFIAKEQGEIEKYFDFVLSLVDIQEIKDRILSMKESLVVYILDKKSTKIPRTLEGNERSFSLPVRAAAL